MKRRVVEVEWVDAQASSGWHGRARYEDNGPAMPVNVSVGYVIKDTPEEVIIGQSYEQNGALVADSLQLPRSYIRRVTTVRRGRSI